MRKGEVEIILRKNGMQDITIVCPEKIKLSALMVYAVIQFGLPPMNIKPIDKKGLAITIIAYLGIFLACAFFAINIALGFLLLIAALIFNFMYTKNYFFNYIKKRLAEGYIPTTKETQKILQNAGLQPKEFEKQNSNTNNSSIPDITEQLEKLHSLMEKGILSKDEFNTRKAKLLEGN